MKARLIKEDGRLTEIEPKNGTDFKLKELQDYIGGLIEIVYLPNEFILIVDEEGLLKERQYNMAASFVAGQTIVGTAILCKASQVK